MASVDRPKSAGVANTGGFMSGLVGVNRGSSGTATRQDSAHAQQSQGAAVDGNHSYGSLKNRFLSAAMDKRKAPAVPF